MKKFTPIVNGYETAVNTITNEGVAISVEYLDKDKLLKIAKHYSNPYLGGSESPQIVTFMLRINNKRSSKISVNADNMVLLDGLGKQNKVLTFDTFKEIYPTTLGQQYQYSFIFDRYYVDTYYTDDYYKRKEADRTLFKGGIIQPGSKIEGIIAFNRISEAADVIEVLLPKVDIYDNDKIIKSIDYNFKFRQTVQRIN